MPDDQTNQQPQVATQIPDEIRTFLDSLLQDAGMLELDDAMHEEMIKELYARLDNFIASTIIDSLPDDSVEEFIRMNEQKKPQAEIEQFLKDKIPNSQEVMSQAFINFRDLYLGNVSAARNAPQANSTPPAAEQTEIDSSKEDSLEPENTSQVN